MNQTTIAAPDVAIFANWRRRLTRPFFVAMSIILLLMVLVGFAPTLYLRPFFEVPEIPTYLFVHGIVLTIWFLWLVAQSSLVALHRTDLHRRVGIVGAGIAVLVVAVSLMTALNFVPRMRDIGTDMGAEAVTLVDLVTGSILRAVTFAALVILAIAHRRRPEVHKRLMLFASIGMIGPAGSRMPAALDAFGLSPNIAFLFLVALLAGPIVYDFLSRGRLHAVTLICTPLSIVFVLLSSMLARLDSVRALFIGPG